MQIDICGYAVLIDDEDLPLIEKYGWQPEDEGPRGAYFKVKIQRNKVRRTHALHRMIMGCVPGDGKILDHINCNKLDNRKCNLRFTTHSDNNRNVPCRSTSRTGLKGVEFYKGKFRAKIWHNGKFIHLGRFRDPYQAHQAYAKAVEKLYPVYGRAA